MESDTDLQTFETFRGDLTALAYRMLGDVGRAEDVVQEAWLRWARRDAVVDTPRAYLLTIVTRLCLNELDSARARREESRADRLPEPVDLQDVGIDPIEAVEQVSMAFLVVLERLAPAERAVLLLHDVFDFTHEEIAPLVARSPAACRKLLERAKEKIAAGRRAVLASREEHQRMLDAFLLAAQSGDVSRLVGMLAEDATIVTDGGPTGRKLGRLRNLPEPLQGAERVAAFVASRARVPGLERELRELNGLPAMVFYRDNQPFGALSIAVSEGKIHQVFFHADLERLGHLGPRRLG